MFVAAVLATTAALGQDRPASENPISIPGVTEKLEADLEEATDFSVSDVAAAQQFGQTIGLADWLGPLAPIGLSPFFGITCLSAIANWGDVIGLGSDTNPLLREGSPLHNPAVFWTFLVLTLLTSVPRFTKVSKPFAQAIDQVEAWAGIITLIALKIVLSATAPETESAEVVQLGVWSFTVDTLLILEAAINIFVINAVKFFFEVLIWITPVPAIDAIFEVANKTVCGVLMAIYAFSPTVAMAINLVLFAIALLVFRWAYRREVFFRTLLLDTVWALVSPPKKIDGPELVVFPVSALGPIPSRARCRFAKTDSGWTVTWQRLLRQDVAVELSSTDCQADLQTGYFTNSIQIIGRQPVELSFSRWYNNRLPELAEALGANLDNPADAEAPTRATLKAELA